MPQNGKSKDKDATESFEVFDLRELPFILLPNHFIDEHIAMQPRTWKLLIYLLRISGRSRWIRASVREIARATGLRPSAVQVALEEMEERGLVQRESPTAGTQATDQAPYRVGIAS